MCCTHIVIVLFLFLFLNLVRSFAVTDNFTTHMHLSMHCAQIEIFSFQLTTAICSFFMCMSCMWALAHTHKTARNLSTYNISDLMAYNIFNVANLYQDASSLQWLLILRFSGMVCFFLLHFSLFFSWFNDVMFHFGPPHKTNELSQRQNFVFTERWEREKKTTTS